MPGSERESSYNFIQVAQSGDTRWLFLNDSLVYHSIYNPHTVRTGGIIVSPVTYIFEEEPPRYTAMLAALKG